MRERIVCNRSKKSALDVGKRNALVSQRIVQKSTISRLTATPRFIARAAAVPAACPMAIHNWIGASKSLATGSEEKQRPATSSLSSRLGIRER